MEQIGELMQIKHAEMEKLIHKKYDDPEMRKLIKYVYYLGVSIGMGINRKLE